VKKMSLEKITDKESKKYESVLKGLDVQNITNSYSRSYSKENDGGVKSILGNAYNSFSSQDIYGLKKNDSESANKLLDSYCEKLFESVEPEFYKTLKPALDKLNGEEKRQQIVSILSSYTGVDARYINQVRESAYDTMVETGNAIEGIEIFEQALKNKDRGMPKGKAMKDLVKQLQDPKDAVNIVSYVADNYLAKRGYSMDEAQKMLIATNTNKAIDFIDSAVNNRMDSYFMSKYNITDSYAGKK
jgi:hypothetical protein